ncbi:hypothetical protein [uncultured Dubosiella sp.]|uniref:hypothetical protein n=1 Tax=uncultured Dubosiella sp. TaxID=1937011 RepID=UPI0025B56CFB|nr:hypothetical protein [uncultured Dubosiella sp.]
MPNIQRRQLIKRKIQCRQRQITRHVDFGNPIEKTVDGLQIFKMLDSRQILKNRWIRIARIVPVIVNLCHSVKLFLRQSTARRKAIVGRQIIPEFRVRKKLLGELNRINHWIQRFD